MQVYNERGDEIEIIKVSGCEQGVHLDLRGPDGTPTELSMDPDTARQLYNAIAEAQAMCLAAVAREERGL